MKKYIYTSDTPFYGTIAGVDVALFPGCEYEFENPQGVIAELIANNILKIKNKK